MMYEKEAVINTWYHFDRVLTFESAKAAFSKYGVEFSETKYRTLGMTDASGVTY